MDCIPNNSNTRTHVIVGACVTAIALVAALLLVVAMRWQRILAELAQIRVNRVKRG